MFRTVKRIMDWCAGFRGRIWLGFVFSFFSYWFAAAPIMIAGWTIGNLIVGTLNLKWIWLSFVLIALSVLLRFLTDYMRARFQETVSYELVARDRLNIGESLKRVSLGYFEKKNTGMILNSITAGLNMLEGMGIRMLDTFIGGYLNFTALFISLLIVSPIAALIALVAAALSFVFLSLVSHHSIVNAPVEADSAEALTGAALEYARGLSVVKSFGQDGEAEKAMKDAASESRRIHLRMEWGFMPSNGLHLLALRCGSAAIAFSACMAALMGTMSIPVMLVIIFISFTMFAALEPVSDSVHVLGIIDDAMNHVDALREENFIDSDGSDIRPDCFDIEFDHVGFGYEKERRIIDDVSFTIKENTSTAVVGPSGSGKTTLMNLLARFYDVDEGHIRVGGHDLREFTCDSLLRNISMVFQNVYLFNDTVMNNIRFGNPDATDEMVYEAARKAGCHDFVMNLPDGYDTMVGEGGSSLSGGEKQRISIARAMLKDAPIIILDEATASVDPENEHLIQNAITELTRGRTIITIAHRLATIENADQILVMDNGRIVQKGTHSELIAQEGLYSRFIQIRRKAEGWSIGSVQ